MGPGSMRSAVLVGLHVLYCELSAGRWPSDTRRSSCPWLVSPTWPEAASGGSSPFATGVAPTRTAHEPTGPPNCGFSECSQHHTKGGIPNSQRYAHVRALPETRRRTLDDPFLRRTRSLTANSPLREPHPPKPERFTPDYLRSWCRRCHTTYSMLRRPYSEAVHIRPERPRRHLVLVDGESEVVRSLLRNTTVETSTTAAFQMAELLGPRRLVLDMGSGSGALSAAVATRWPRTKVVAVDVAGDNGPDQAHRFVRGDVLTFNLGVRFSGIVANPPYERAVDIGLARRAELRVRFYSARSQFDLWFAFVERALQLLEPGGRGVFLIPAGLETRPAAARLRDVLSAYSRWSIDRNVRSAFVSDVGVAPELLIFDRNDEHWGSSHERISPLFDVDAQVSVGAATGANSVFVREEGEAWLQELWPRYVRSVVRGRDIRQGWLLEDRPRLVFPYVRGNSRLEPAPLDQNSSLAAFIAAHRGSFSPRAPAPGLFIQCPPLAVLGTRLALPEIFCEPRGAIVEDGVVILNSAFAVDVGTSLNAQAMLDWLLSDAASASLAQHSRPVSGDYRRITASGVSRLLADFRSPPGGW